MHGLVALHESLDQFFQALNQERSGPTWIIEHTLDDERRAEVQSQLRGALRERKLDGSYFWRVRAWPLLVEATEVGYTYEGAEPGPR